MSLFMPSGIGKPITEDQILNYNEKLSNETFILPAKRNSIYTIVPGGDSTWAGSISITDKVKNYTYPVYDLYGRECRYIYAKNSLFVNVENTSLCYVSRIDFSEVKPITAIIEGEAMEMYMTNTPTLPANQHLEYDMVEDITEWDFFIHESSCVGSYGNYSPGIYLPNGDNIRYTKHWGVASKNFIIPIDKNALKGAKWYCYVLNVPRQLAIQNISVARF